jgi:hypothetical protein
MPGIRADRITLAKVWAEKVQAKATAWGIPEAKVDALDAVIVAIETAVAAEAQEKSPSKVMAARLADKELQRQMRFMKSHYFLVPPLTSQDCVDLQIKVPGANPSNPIPTAVNGGVIAEFKPLGPHLLKVSLAINGDFPPGSKQSWYGYKIYFAVIDPALTGETDTAVWSHIPAAPVNGTDLPNSVATNRATYLFDFPEADRGKVVWFCVVLENKKHKEGPWGPLANDMVP